MPAPSRRTGLPATFIGLALAVILIAGFALGPRAFEFSAWPQPSQRGSVQEVVARPSDEATEVPVARVRRGERNRGRSRGEALSARGRSTRGDRLAASGVTLDARSPRRGANGSAPRGGNSRDGDSGGDTQTDPPVVVVVDETPAPAPDSPAEQPAEQPAQLAEAPPPAEHVLRPDAEELGSVPEPQPQLESEGLLDEVDRLIDTLLPGESRHGRHGRGHGHR